MNDLEEQLTDMLQAQSGTFGVSDDAWERAEARMNRRTPAWRPLAAGAAIAAACAAVPLTLSATGPNAPPPPNVSVSGPVSGSAPRPAPSQRPTPTRSSVTLSASSAAKQLQAFLDSWRRNGLVVASRTYLVEDEQVTDKGDALVLAKGRVIKVTSSSRSADGLALDVEIDLTFRGATGAWGNGVNTRFVTFTPREGTVPFVMSIATGP
ncbi:hypothetical protein J4573_13190 [Actinomadura barringtoniae]|uniref:Uncharacterized protein n=1 Tax=Actinomadura barringtoniae TaxID=1427535 RepID=A0A939P9M8_9ACTN|nr:hypothetical protein [Actinomadura barringtoniae]MBO2448052.1 hypothetical protein [Actinomadura barringtoniae]